ncbi:hypothetical protein E2562_013957 [Oryza meyeriana var. granulata]|uniref:Uncharacterized protein n=1 Tax=Oryza meyeriana var. granulata TaxID=110450 RepID=A0A6G1DJ81_9ORYZ|nr:hypothetical protein E2562_013957 [Oryza meyeriana var. granulata]
MPRGFPARHRYHGSLSRLEAEETARGAVVRESVPPRCPFVPPPGRKIPQSTLVSRAPIVVLPCSGYPVYLHSRIVDGTIRSRGEVLMDLIPLSSFPNFLQDSKMARNFSQSASQVAPVGHKKHTPDLNRNPEPMVRPIGIKRAKKGKGTTDEVTLEVKELLKTLMQIQATQKEELEGIKDLLQKLSDQRFEAATLQLKAAQEEKEAKLLDHKNKLLENFIELV